MWFKVCTVVVLIGLDTILDNDLIGDDFISSPSVFSFCRSGAIECSSGFLSARLQPLDEDDEGSINVVVLLLLLLVLLLLLPLPQLIMERVDADLSAAPFATFCFNEFCCDGDNVLS